MDNTQIFEDIINLVEIKHMTQAYVLFKSNIRKVSHMEELLLCAFSSNKDKIGKELFKFNFVIKNVNYQSIYSPFKFFCFVCKNEYLEILFRIIEDPFFWNKDKVIFEPELQQTPRQWLIATTGYIMCSLNKIKSLELLCDKYNITKFDAEESHFFEIAAKNNFNELLLFLINRYGFYTPIEKNGICETSLYDVPEYYRNIKSLDNPMYIEYYITKVKIIKDNKNDNNGFYNPIYAFI